MPDLATLALPTAGGIGRRAAVLFVAMGYGDSISILLIGAGGKLLPYPPAMSQRGGRDAAGEAPPPGEGGDGSEMP